MKRHRRGPATHVLIAGDEGDLEVIAHIVAALPPDAFGQLLMETPIDMGPPAISAPARVSIQWLPRTTATLPGHRLAESLAGWAREWLVEGDRELHECHYLFLGAAGRQPVDVVREVLFVDQCSHLAALGDIVVTRASSTADTRR